jgi:hypothetical protein
MEASNDIAGQDHSDARAVGLGQAIGLAPAEQVVDLLV